MSTLQEAVALIKAGDGEGGRRILAQLLAQDPANEAAWLWMSSVVEQEEQREHCLRQVLKHNPEHALARAALDHLQKSRLREEVPQPSESQPGLEPAEEEELSRQEVSTAKAPAPRQGAEVWQPPAAPARDPAMLKDMADYVISRLGRHETLEDIVPKLCEVAGMSWSEATAFVQRVEEERRPEIAGRQRPVLLLLGVVSLLIGGYLAYTSAAYLSAFMASAGDLSENPLVYILSTPQLLRRVLTLVLATAILAGGLWGIVRALMPPGDKSLLEPEAGTGSIDDFIGIHVSVGGQQVASSRRRRRSL